MRIESIELRNIASYGNALQRIDFTKKESNLYLTIGKNGYGKTTIANAIVFALYGKLDGVSLQDLPNRINKNLWVKIKLLCGTKKVEVERGLAPKKFKVTINGIEHDRAGKTNVQEYLEKEIYGIPYRVFKNVIILSVNDFKSFLTMGNKDKREIIDRLFGFSIINEMYSTIKLQKREVKQEIKTLEDELNSITESISSVNLKLNELEQSSSKENKKQVKILKGELLELDSNRKKLSSAKETLVEKYHELDIQISSKNTSYSNKNQSLQRAEKGLSLYEQSLCPHCESKLDTKFHEHRKEEFNHILESAPGELEIIEDEIKDLRNQAAINRGKQEQIIGRVSSLNTSILSLKQNLIDITNSFKAGDQYKDLSELISEFKDKETKKTRSKNKKGQQDYFYDNIESILGDDGVKNLAIKTILPALNSNIAGMTDKMHLNFHIRFDEKFNCLINHLGEDVNPMTLSTGERKKADFIIIIAIIKLMKLRFPQLNILFLDEIFSSVDADGVHNILRILSKVIKENNINTFVINHTVLPHEIFDKKLEIYRENGFSKFTIETIN